MALISRLIGTTVLTLPPGPIPLRIFGRNDEIAEPNPIPRIPPTKPTNPELRRKIINISLFFAPIAFMIPVGYFSTMAIFYLAYSTLWKEISHKNFVVFSNIFAVIISLTAFITGSYVLLTLLQFFLIVFTVIISLAKHNTEKKKFSARTLYLLISVFWLINLFLVAPRRFLHFEFKIVLEIISLAVF